MARIIVVGNEKGGSGKSTTCMHVATALARMGQRVGALDLDLRQRSFARYAENRRAYLAKVGLTLPSPDFQELPVAHTLADTLITPMNDSFVDFDLLARVDPVSGQILGPSIYAEMVWGARQRRAEAGMAPIDWIVVRNRLGAQAMHNKKKVGGALEDLSRRIGFRVLSGFSERVIFRELFPRGLTLLDLADTGVDQLSLSNIAARQELRDLMSGLKLPALTGF
ncbi:MAG: ATPase [Rhodobacterales bacterium 32-66-7]|nr:MAG: ATPase [Rhodobacterales bacterium 32-66-7]